MKRRRGERHRWWFFFIFSDAAHNSVLRFDDRRAVGQPDRDLRGGQTGSDAHFPESVHSQLGCFRHDSVLGVHAVHADVDIATPVDHGHRVVQTRATVAGHQHYGVGGHDHGDRHRSLLGDRPRIRAKRKAHGVRVHSYRMAVGRPDHIARSLLPGKHYGLTAYKNNAGTIETKMSGWSINYHTDSIPT